MELESKPVGVLQHVDWLIGIATALIALFTFMFMWWSWSKSELRETKRELEMAHRDVRALQREVTRLLHVAYPERPHEHP